MSFAAPQSLNLLNMKDTHNATPYPLPTAPNLDIPPASIECANARVAESIDGCILGFCWTEQWDDRTSLICGHL